MTKPRRYRGHLVVHEPKSKTGDKPAGDQAIAVLYVRVSKEEQDLSPEAQVEAAERWCTTNKATLVASFEERLSSVTPIDQRPELLKALAACASLGAGILLVMRRDRVARDPIITAMVERLAERAGARLTSISGEGNGASAVDQLMRRVCDAFAEYELAMIRQRTSAAIQAKLARGEPMGQPPFGWRRSKDESRFLRHETEQLVIEKAAELRAGGASWRKIPILLAELGLVGKDGQPYTPMLLFRAVGRHEGGGHKPHNPEHSCSICKGLKEKR